MTMAGKRKVWRWPWCGRWWWFKRLTVSFAHFMDLTEWKINWNSSVQCDKKKQVARRAKIGGRRQHESRYNKLLLRTDKRKHWCKNMKYEGMGEEIFLARSGWMRMWWILSICWTDDILKSWHKVFPNGGTKCTHISGHIHIHVRRI